MKYIIYKPAQLQLINIWNYTEKQWVEEQADKYIKNLRKTFQEISLKPELWKKLEYKKLDNVFYFKYEKHFIFFKMFSNKSIGIISILHERMNLPERLMDDFKNL